MYMYISMFFMKPFIFDKLLLKINLCYMLLSGLEIREYGRRDPSRWPRGTLYPQKLALTSLLGRYSSLADSGHRVEFFLSTCYFDASISHRFF
jgi:hypothetical protein